MAVSDGDQTRPASFDSALREIVAGTSSTGARFFEELVQALGRALGVRYAFIAGFTDDTRRRVRTHALAVDGLTADPIEYDLAGTPCANVATLGTCFYRDAVTALFPDDQLLVDMGARSYLGVPLRSSVGEVLGILVVVHDGPLNETVAPESILQVFAGRGASELERLDMERRLRASETRFALAARTSHDLIFDWDLPARRAVWGAAAPEVFGLSPDELGATLDEWLARIHPEDRAGVESSLAAALDSAPDFHAEYRLAAGGGHYLQARQRGLILRDPHRRPLRMVGSIENATRLLDTKALQEGLLARIALAIPGVAYLFNIAEERFIFTSRDTTPLLGLDVTTIEGRDQIPHRLHPGDRARALAEVRARLVTAADGEVAEADVRFRSPKNPDAWLSLRLWETVFERTPDGRPHILLGVMQDVTAIKQLEIDARLRRVVERLPLPVSLSDPSGRRELANPAYEKLVGLSIADAPTVADAIRTLVPDAAEMQRVGSAVREYRQRRQPGESLHIEQVQVRTVRGQDRSLDIHMFEDGDLGVTTFVDVTERVKNETALRRAHEQLAAAVRDLESFSYSVSHDLRAPLRHIDGFARALERELGDKLSGDARRHFDRITAAARRMDRLIEGVLSLSSVGQAPLRETDVDLSALAAELADEHVQATRDRRIEWIIAPGIVARGDALLLRIALGNLLDNAVKYSARREVAHIELGARERDGRLLAFVSDDGAGFDMRYAHRLFGAFQRLHSESEFPGHGIGLATVARVFGRHGGGIEAAGAPGGGATFSFWLPGLSRRSE